MHEAFPNAAGALEALWDTWWDLGSNPQVGYIDEALEAAAILRPKIANSKLFVTTRLL